jgi:hypothetical protein
VPPSGLSSLNPWLYNDGYKALTDIVDDGSTGWNAGIPYASWNATTGWDPATGIGHAESPKDCALHAHQLEHVFLLICRAGYT